MSVPDMNYCGPVPSVTYSVLPSKLSPHLTVIVRNYSGGEPIRNATVSLWRGGDKRPAFSFHSDQIGRVQFIDVPAAHYDLRIARQGYRPTVLKQLLVTRESGTLVDFLLLQRKWIVACE